MECLFLKYIFIKGLVVVNFLGDILDYVLLDLKIFRRSEVFSATLVICSCQLKKNKIKKLSSKVLVNYSCQLLLSIK